MIGVLALQGGFIEHIHALEKLGVPNFEIREMGDLEKNKPDGIILPGGESTTIGKLLHSSGLFQCIDDLIRSGVPVFGTCAGMILLAKRIVNDDRLYFQSMDISVKRNAYGRQLGSFCAVENFEGIGRIPMTFIRAPFIERIDDENVQILCRMDDHIVAARQKNMLVTSFHPELTDDLRVHQYFLDKF